MAATDRITTAAMIMTGSPVRGAVSGKTGSMALRKVNSSVRTTMFPLLSGSRGF